MPRPRVSVVVPSYHGSAVIADCLRSIETSLRDHDGEVVVVDSSTDHTPDVVAGSFPQVRLVRSDTRLTAGQARNLGAESTTSDVVLFVDQDCIVPSDWVRRLLDALQTTGADGAGGSITNATPRNLAGTTLFFLEFMHHLPHRGGPTLDKSFLLGCNAAFTRRVIDTVRFPDRTIAEDVLFSARMRAHGLRLAYLPSVSVAHVNKTGWKRVFAYLRELGRASAVYHRTLGWKRPVLSAPVLVFLAPLVILPSLLARIVASGRLRDLVSFLVLLPACAAGNLVWATGFYREATGDAPRDGRP